MTDYEELEDVHSWQEREDQERQRQFVGYFERLNTEDPNESVENINQR